MEQKGHKGRYPIHWHMARQIKDPTKTYAMDNAIHHVFQRCVTVHGTHGVNVANNVAYSNFGHCGVYGTPYSHYAADTFPKTNCYELLFPKRMNGRKL